MFQPLLPNHMLMQPPMLLLVLGVLLVLWPLAVLLFARAWRGQPVGLAPTCRRCGFDLSGTVVWPPDASADRPCPECGTRLGRPGVLGLGRLRRHPGRLLLGAAAVMLTSAPALWLGAVLVQGVNWENYRSTAGLLQSLRSGRSDQATHEAVARRIAAGRLDENEMARALVERVASAKPLPLHSHLGSALVPRLNNGTLAPETVQALFRAMVMGASAAPAGSGTNQSTNPAGLGWTVNLVADTSFFWRLSLGHPGARMLAGLPPTEVVARNTEAVFTPDGGGPPRSLSIRGTPGSGVVQASVTLLGPGAFTFLFNVSPEPEMGGPGRLTVRAEIFAIDPIQGGEYGPWPVEVTVGWAPPN
jgi:hypothetical protein